MEIIIVGLLIILNGFFALSEIALVSSRKNRLLELQKKGNYGAKIAIKLMGNSEHFLSAIQVGITLIGIVLGAYSGVNIAEDITPFASQIPFIGQFAEKLAITITIVLITYVSIVIGELVPKTIAMSNPEKVAVIVAPVIHVVSIIFFPFVKLLSVSTNLINSIIGITPPEEQISRAELRQLMRDASESGVIASHQFHDKLFNFEGKRAHHLMTHRTDVECIDLNSSIEKIYRELSHVKHAKIVCYRTSIDCIEGIIDITDYFRYRLANSSEKLESIITKPVFVGEMVEAQKLIPLFRDEQIQFCVVLNEYGGFEGIISLHDIIEGIIGDIPDEGENDSEEITFLEDDSIQVEGDSSVEILQDIIPNLEFHFDEMDYTTGAGFVLEHLADLPVVGDSFEYLNFRFEVVAMDENRIETITITQLVA